MPCSSIVPITALTIPLTTPVYVFRESLLLVLRRSTGRPRAADSKWQGIQEKGQDKRQDLLVALIIT